MGSWVCPTQVLSCSGASPIVTHVRLKEFLQNTKKKGGLSRGSYSWFQSDCLHSFPEKAHNFFQRRTLACETVSWLLYLVKRNTVVFNLPSTGKSFHFIRKPEGSKSHSTASFSTCFKVNIFVLRLISKVFAQTNFINHVRFLRLEEWSKSYSHQKNLPHRCLLIVFKKGYSNQSGASFTRFGVSDSSLSKFLT